MGNFVLECPPCLTHWLLNVFLAGLGLGIFLAGLSFVIEDAWEKFELKRWEKWLNKIGVTIEDVKNDEENSSHTL